MAAVKTGAFPLFSRAYRAGGEFLRSNLAVAGKKTLSRWKLVASGSWLAGQEFPLYEEGTVLGRGKTCDITIPGTHLSRAHTELVVSGDQLYVRDLESANGTFLNNERVTEAAANIGDVLRMDVYSFRIEGPNSAIAATDNAKQAKAAVHVAASQSLENIRNLKKNDKDYSETQWITKPTSVGNRTHNVPSHSKSADMSFWVAIALGLIVIAGLTSYFLL